MIVKRLSRPGLSAVELILVIGIIGFGFSLLFPAVQQARHSSLTHECENNLRKIGVGLNLYREANAGRFPTAPCMPRLDTTRYSLPQVLFEFVNRDVTVFRCPSDPKFFREEGTSYEYPQGERGPSGQTLAEL